MVGPKKGLMSVLQSRIKEKKAKGRSGRSVAALRDCAGHERAPGASLVQNRKGPRRAVMREQSRCLLAVALSPL